MPGDFGFDPLNLGTDAEYLKIWREAELQHCRWAMLGVAGVLGQAIMKPDVDFYTAPQNIELPFSVPTLIGAQFLMMHYVEIRRWRDLKKPGSVDADPFNGNLKLPAHEVGYPGGIFAPVVPGNLDDLKLKEIKNGRLAMVAFAGFIAQYQVTGKGPLDCLGAHLADPGHANIFAGLN
jgi:light-harvesting complex I chlorophyll a/b binding protein 4